MKSLNFYKKKNNKLQKSMLLFYFFAIVVWINNKKEKNNRKVKKQKRKIITFCMSAKLFFVLKFTTYCVFSEFLEKINEKSRAIILNYGF